MDDDSSITLTYLDHKKLEKEKKRKENWSETVYLS
jgi:hypothetical protein